jgi:hypothetical protein
MSQSLYRDYVLTVVREVSDHLIMDGIQARFDALARRHRMEENVGWGLSDQIQRGYWVFHNFGNYSRVSGRGAECLREVCALADEFGIDLHLWTGSPALHSYYETFGFVKIESPRYKADEVQWFERSALCETRE